MVEIPSIRKFGHSSSSFFKRRVLGRRQGVHFNGYCLIIGVTGLIIVALLIPVFYRQTQSLDTVGQAAYQLQRITALAQKVNAARHQADQYLINGRAEDFAVSSTALAALSQAIQSTLDAADESTRYDLLPLGGLAQAYYDRFRSLGMLMTVSSLPGKQPARPQIQQSLTQAGNQLDDFMDTLSINSTKSLNKSITNAGAQNALIQNLLLVVIAILCVISSLLSVAVTGHMASGLDAIQQAAHAVAAGNFEVQIRLSHNRELNQLALAFNQMAASVRTSLQTKAAVNEQNRQQIMKLARQERMTTILQERQRIAGELHDSVKQQLFSVTLAAGAALNLLDHDVALARTYLAHVQQTSINAQSEMTTLLQEMTPSPLHDHPLEDALCRYLIPLCELHALKLLWRVEGTNTLTVAQEHALFRAVQEAAANTVRHSRATNLRVSLRFGLRTLLVIEDNGQGFDPETAAPDSTGLATMRRRLKQVSGKIDLRSTIGGGTRIEIVLDLRKQIY